MSTGLGLKRDHDHFSMCKNKDDEWDGEIRGQARVLSFAALSALIIVKFLKTDKLLGYDQRRRYFAN